MTTDTQIISDLPIPPGEYLEEVLEDLGMSKGELATRMGRPQAKLSQIFNGSKAITPDTALELERATTVAAHIWTGLENDYRLSLARQRETEREEQLQQETALVTIFCYAQLAKIGMFERQTRAIEKVRQLQGFFGVMSLYDVLKVPRYAVAHRHGARKEDDRSPEAVAAWLRVGELKAATTDCAPFDKQKLRAILPELRAMTLQQPEIFSPRLKELLAEAGVVLVLCPHFPKTKAQGATFFVNPDKAVLMLSLRYSWADIFWFTLFHEIGHLLLHKIKNVILEEDGKKDQRENEADEFARDQLISAGTWESFISGGPFTAARIKAFAEEVGICPGIVVGRLLHEKKIRPDVHADMRHRYQFSGGGK